LGNQFLGNIRECAAIVEVVRCFEDENITHVDGTVDPVRDVETIETELILSDIETVTKRREKFIKIRGDKDAQAAAAELGKLLDHLNAGERAASFELSDNEQVLLAMKEMGLLTAKNTIFCANVDENGLTEENAHVKALKALAEKRGSECVVICAKLEEELQGLSDAEQKEMLEGYGVSESGLVRVIKSGYKTLGLISFFTAGEKEDRAWTIHAGWKAPQAAGVIHTDFEKGFIRAEVIAY